MSEAHALPDGCEQVEYSDFLEKGGHLVAAIFRRGFEFFNLILIPALTMLEGRGARAPYALGVRVESRALKFGITAVRRSSPTTPWSQPPRQWCETRQSK